MTVLLILGIALWTAVGLVASTANGWTAMPDGSKKFDLGDYLEGWALPTFVLVIGALIWAVG